jgi:hypothetical protein
VFAKPVADIECLQTCKLPVCVSSPPRRAFGRCRVYRTDRMRCMEDSVLETGSPNPGPDSKAAAFPNPSCRPASVATVNPLHRPELWPVDPLRSLFQPGSRVGLTPAKDNQLAPSRAAVGRRAGGKDLGDELALFWQTGRGGHLSAVRYQTGWRVSGPRERKYHAGTGSPHG